MLSSADGVENFALICVQATSTLTFLMTHEFAFVLDYYPNIINKFLSATVVRRLDNDACLKEFLSFSSIFDIVWAEFTKDSLFTQ